MTNNRKFSAFIPAAFNLFVKLSVACTIITSFVFLTSQTSLPLGDVKGVQTTLPSASSDIQIEVDKTLQVISKRPDYAGAWLRLSVLYKELGDTENAQRANDEARKLNPDL